MKFVEIRAELVTKEKVLYNTYAHINFKIDRLNFELSETAKNISHVTNMIFELDQLTKDAE